MDQQTSSQVNAPGVINAVHGFRYQVKDVARAVAFYTQRLGFTVKHQQLPAFANVSLGGADVLLSGPGASGSRPMPNGERQDTRWLEPHRAEGDRSARLHRRAQARRCHVSQRDGGGSGWPADTDRRSGWESTRIVRAGLSVVNRDDPTTPSIRVIALSTAGSSRASRKPHGGCSCSGRAWWRASSCFWYSPLAVPVTRFSSW